MRPTTFVLAIFFSLLLIGCGGGGGDGDGGAAPDTTIHVHAVNGNDTTGDGSTGNPFRTITAALLVAGPGVTVQVGAGTYDAALGEVFPLRPGSGVTVRGFLSFVPGTPRHRTLVIGGDFCGCDAEGRLHGTFHPAPGSTLFGLSIQNLEPFGPLTGPKPAAVVLSAADVTIESCLLHGSNKGIRMVQGAFSAILKRSEFSGNGVGIFVDGAGPQCSVEDCMITSNSIGVLARTTGVDFGGGSAGSTGGNSFIKSAGSDFVYHVSLNLTAFARNCCWDNAVPTLSVGVPPPLPDSDIWEDGATVDFTGATECPPSGGGPIGLPPPIGAIE